MSGPERKRRIVEITYRNSYQPPVQYVVEATAESLQSTIVPETYSSVRGQYELAEYLHTANVFMENALYYSNVETTDMENLRLKLRIFYERNRSLLPRPLFHLLWLVLLRIDYYLHWNETVDDSTDQFPNLARSEVLIVSPGIFKMSLLKLIRAIRSVMRKFNFIPFPGGELRDYIRLLYLRSCDIYSNEQPLSVWNHPEFIDPQTREITPAFLDYTESAFYHLEKKLAQYESITRRMREPFVHINTQLSFRLCVKVLQMLRTVSQGPLKYIIENRYRVVVFDKYVFPAMTEIFARESPSSDLSSYNIIASKYSDDTTNVMNRLKTHSVQSMFEDRMNLYTIMDEESMEIDRDMESIMEITFTNYFLQEVGDSGWLSRLFDLDDYTSNVWRQDVPPEIPRIIKGFNNFCIFWSGQVQAFVSFEKCIAAWLKLAHNNLREFPVDLRKKILEWHNSIYETKDVIFDEEETNENSKNMDIVVPLPSFY